MEAKFYPVKSRAFFAFLFVILSLAPFGKSWGQTTIFTETMGSGGSNGATIASWESSNYYDNDGYTMSGTGDMRNTNASTGYSGSSGTWNVMLNASGEYFQIADINCSSYSSISISIGIRKSTTAENGSTLAIQVSSDGSNWTTLSYSLPTGTGTAIWHLVTPTGSIPSASNLRIKFTSSSTVEFRIDDIKLTGILASVPTITTTLSATSITTSSASSGGQGLSDNGSSITAKGVCWNTITNPTIANSTTNDGTGTADFTSSISGLLAQTRYYVRAYATNGNGTGYGPEKDFYTLSLEPTSYPVAFSAASISSSQIDLSFSAASSITNAAGYIILMKSGSAPTGLPVDATSYSVGNTIGDGTVAAIVTSNSATSATITGLSGSTNYYFTIFPYNWNTSNSETYNYKTDGTPPGSNATTLAAAVAPTITTTTPASSITPTSASSGGSTLNDNGYAISAKGVCWNTSANPTIANPKTDEGTGTADFTSSLATLLPQTFYYARAYASNAGGTGYANEITFYTLSNEPTGQASNLTAATAGTTSQNLSWTAATFPSSGASTKGYILLRAVSPNVPSLLNTDGQAPAVGPNTTIVSSVVASSATSYNVTSLTPCTNYVYKLIPFCWDGNNNATYNYLFASAPESSAVITACASSDAVAAGGESTTISSLENDPAPLGVSDGVQVWQFTIRDGGSTMNDADALPTKISALTFTKNSNNSVADWTDAIKTVALFDGSTFIATASGITDTELQFSGLTLSVPDNSSKTYTLRLSLNANLGTFAGDNQDFVFSLTYQNVLTVSDGTSSRETSFTYIESTDTKNKIDVVGTKLAFKVQPTTTVIDLPMAPSVVVGGTDANNNVDADFSGTISLSSSGTLTGDPVSGTTSSGLATFNSLTHTVAGIGLALTATNGTLGSAVSSTFDITTVAANSYRTSAAGAGTWATASWERFVSGVWSSSTAPSTSTSDFVYIHHAISGGASISPYNVVIENGGTLLISASSTIGTSLLVKSGGTLQTNAALTISGTLTVESGGIVNINYNLINGVSAFWGGTEDFQTGSTLNIQNWNYSTGSGDNRLIQNPSIISLNADGYYFGNLTISGSPSQIFIMSEGSQTINLCSGDFTSSSGGSAVGFTTGLSNVTIGGDLKVTSGQFSFGSTSTAGTFTSTIKGNIELSVGTINLNQTSSGSTYGVVDLSGDLLTSSGTTLTSSDAGCKILLDGSATQNINLAGTLGSNVEFEVQNGNLVQLAGQNLALSNASNKMTVLNGGTLFFNGFNATGSGTFTQNSGGHLIITSTDGITSSGSTGNVQTTTRSFNTGGNFTYTGTVAQVTGSGLPTTVNNFTVDNSAGVSLTASSLTTTGNLTINSGKLFNIDYNKQVNVNGSLINNGDETSLIIKSTASGTGSLIHNTDNVKATIQRYITGNTNTHIYKYHFVSIPLTPANESLSGLFYDSYLWDFDETINNWRAWGTPTTNILDETRGYIIYYRFADFTYEFPGPINNGNFSPAVTLTERGKPAVEQGWNLIPNPYPSAIDWDLVSSTDRPNIEGGIYIWPADNDGSGGSSSYYYYVGGISVPLGALDGTIPIGQSFMVHANGGTPDITFYNNDRVHSSQGFLKKKYDEVPNLLYLIASDSTKNDQAAIRFLDEATENFDSEWDAYKFLGGQHSLNICSMSGDGFKLSINSLPTENKDIIIPIYFYYTDSASVTIKASNLQSFDTVFPIYFEDKLLDKRVNLRDENYIFEHDGDTVIDRFQIRFNITYGIDEHNIVDGKIFMLNGKLNIDIPEFNNEKVSLQVLDLTGKTILSSDLKMNGNTQTDFHAATGYYVVKISDGKKQFVSKLFVH